MGTKNAHDVVLLTFNAGKWYAAGGANVKVKDVTLGGESIVDSDGVVKLEKTVMTNNYIPVWNNTNGAFEDGVAAGGTSGYVLTAQGPSAKPAWKAVKSISSITVTKV